MSKKITGRPPKTTDAQWAHAKALFEAGKPLREIELETSIGYTQISKEAKYQRWEKGVLQKIVNDAVQVRTDFANLDLQQKMVVAKDVEKIMEGKQFYAESARKVAKVALHALGKDPSNEGAKKAMETILLGMRAEQVVPYYSPGGNVNISQDNSDKTVIMTEEQAMEAINKYNRVIDA